MIENEQLVFKDEKGRFVKGFDYSNENQFKKGNKPHNYIEDKQKIECGFCGKEIECEPWKLKQKGSLRKKYCSKKCSNIGQGIVRGKLFKGVPKSDKFRGSNHPRWVDGEGVRHRTIEWFEIRKKVLERDGHKCVDCGEIEDLIVHHTTPWRICKNHELETLVTVCRSCHTTREHKLFRQYKMTLRTVNN